MCFVTADKNCVPYYEIIHGVSFSVHTCWGYSDTFYMHDIKSCWEALDRGVTFLRTQSHTNVGADICEAGLLYRENEVKITTAIFKFCLRMTSRWKHSRKSSQALSGEGRAGQLQ